MPLESVVVEVLIIISELKQDELELQGSNDRWILSKLRQTSFHPNQPDTHSGICTTNPPLEGYQHSSLPHTVYSPAHHLYSKHLTLTLFAAR